MKNLFYNYKIPKRFSPFSIRNTLYEDKNKILYMFGFMQCSEIERQLSLLRPVTIQIESIFMGIAAQYKSQYVSLRIFNY